MVTGTAPLQPPKYIPSNTISICTKQKSIDMQRKIFGEGRPEEPTADTDLSSPSTTVNKLLESVLSIVEHDNQFTGCVIISIKPSQAVVLLHRNL